MQQIHMSVTQNKDASVRLPVSINLGDVTGVDTLSISIEILISRQLEKFYIIIELISFGVNIFQLIITL